MNLARPHTAHDHALIAASAADDLTGAAAREAVELIAACPDCRTLHADLVAIATAIRALPEPVRPRSFTLSAEQAAGLRPRGWQRLVGSRLGDVRLARPVAVACTTLGLAGLLLATVPTGPTSLFSAIGGNGAAAPAATENESMQLQGQTDAPADDAAQPPAPGGEALGPGGVRASPGGDADPPAAAPGASDGDTDRDETANERPADGSPSAATNGTPSQWLLALSLALLSGGLGIFLLTRRRDQLD